VDPNQLIAKGMVWSPSHGDTAFTVPMFDAFMQRTMPGDDWRTAWRIAGRANAILGNRPDREGSAGAARQDCGAGV
jgi:hypothetical protein